MVTVGLLGMQSNIHKKLVNAAFLYETSLTIKYNHYNITPQLVKNQPKRLL